MTIITGWRAEKAVIDGVPVYSFTDNGLVRFTWQQLLDDAHEYALKEDRDREWVARELGDVPHRNKAEQWTPEELAVNPPITAYQFNRIPDYFGETVPVESLGRES